MFAGALRLGAATGGISHGNRGQAGSEGEYRHTETDASTNLFHRLTPSIGSTPLPVGSLRIKFESCQTDTTCWNSSATGRLGRRSNRAARASAGGTTVLVESIGGGGKKAEQMGLRVV